ncbi:Type 2 glycosyltransferase [Pyricularia oryzae]
MSLRYFPKFLTPWLIAFCMMCHWTYKSKPIPTNPSYTADDVTVVIPTIHDTFDEIRPSFESILATQPHKLIIITTADKFDDLQTATKILSSSKICILCTQYANKRIQVCEALPKIKTRIIIMADDDVIWPSTIMPWILAPFEDVGIGGVGTCQRVKRVREGTFASRMWNWLGAAYIERRNFEISATHNMDGGTSCMSGRTGAYRSEILQDYEFLKGFMEEEWWGKILKADDDNFVSRWLVSHQWRTWIQYEPECEVETTLENNIKFLYQCSRWARSNWRSNWTSLIKERYVWKQQWWCTYALHIATFTSLAFAFDFLILAALWWGTECWNPLYRKFALYAQLAFLGFSKLVKLTSWGSRNDGNTDTVQGPALSGKHKRITTAPTPKKSR